MKTSNFNHNKNIESSKNKIRLDNLLVEKGYFSSIKDAQRSILAHEVRINTEYLKSGAVLVCPDVELYVKDRRTYVSRGGYKLKAAIDKFKIDVRNNLCIDIGASSGGFSDVLLQEGASSVTCVDVNYGQLDWKIRTNPKTKVFERCNIKKADPISLGAPFDIIVADVSFISLASITPFIANLAHKQSLFIGLIKPQFEAKSSENNGGLVTSDKVRIRTIEEVKCALSESGFDFCDIIESPIHGKKMGNIEYLISAIYK